MFDANLELEEVNILAQKLVCLVEELINASEEAKPALFVKGETGPSLLRAEKLASSAKDAFEVLESHPAFPQGLSLVMQSKIKDSLKRWHEVLQDLASLVDNYGKSPQKAPLHLDEEDLGSILNESL